MRDAMIDPIKTLASRFASLPSVPRVEIARRLLMRQEEEQDRKCFEIQTHESIGRKSFIEQFWDEVEKSCGDDFQSRNPFAKGNLRFGF